MVATAARKMRKSSGGTAEEVARAVAVVLDQRFNGMETRFNGLDANFDGPDAKVDVGLARLDDRITTLDETVAVGFARVEQDIGRLKVATLEIKRELKNKVDRDEIEPIVERVLARAPRR